MDVFAIDDAAQPRPTRDGMGPLVAVGGLHIPGMELRNLELGLDGICDRYGFPVGEEFKWSPGRNLWMHGNLKFERREEFFLEALGLAAAAGATGIVALEDTERRPASEDSESPEEDVTMLFLERAQATLPADRHGLVIFDRPSGDRKSEFAFLARCLDQIRNGTAFTSLDRLASVLSTDSRLSRAIQLADVVTSCTTALISGEEQWSPSIFEKGILPLLRRSGRCCGGYGLKIQPDYRYGNLYHWHLGDDFLMRTGHPLPGTRCTAYRKSPTKA